MRITMFRDYVTDDEPRVYEHINPVAIANRLNKSLEVTVWVTNWKEAHKHSHVLIE